MSDAPASITEAEQVVYDAWLEILASADSLTRARRRVDHAFAEAQNLDHLGLFDRRRAKARDELYAATRSLDYLMNGDIEVSA